MTKHKKDPLIEVLKQGKSCTWTVPEGGDLASMRKALKHGQTLTMSPISDPAEIKVGDMVLVRWHKSEIFHLVGDIQGDQYLIINSLGGVNGWVGVSEILGRITQVIDPEPRPDVPEMLGLLASACQQVIERAAPADDEAQRLLRVVDDLRWYAERIGEERWDRMPRSNKWSFAQQLWRLMRRIREGNSPVPAAVAYFIDLGKMCVGYASEIVALFDYSNAE